MNYLIKSFLRGLLTLVPLFLSLYVLVWFFNFVETFVRRIIETALGSHIYFTGLGLVGGVICVTIIGIIMSSIIAQEAYAFLEKIIAKLPILKTIYFAIDDFMNFFANSDDEEKAKKVVLVSLPEQKIKLIGILTNDHPEQLVNDVGEKQMAVYLPMSYQIGGFTVFLPETNIETTNLSVEEAMKLSMTAWIKKSEKK